MSPPSLVLIAGSWHQGRCYEKIVALLEKQHKLKCTTVTLPSTQGNPDADFKGDIDTARAAITAETSQGRNAVVIAHSFGGMVGNSAIKGLTRPSQKNTASPSADSGPGHVIGLILIASGFTLTGLSFMDPMFGIPPPSWKVNKETGFADLVTPPRELFYHDLPDEEAELWVSRLGSQSLKAMFEGGEHAYAGWKDVPVWYIGTIEDRGLPVAIQRVQVGMARAMGASVEHRELRSSHSPFLSMPRECTEIVVQAVAAFTGDEKVTADVRQRRSERVVSPTVRILSPATWFRYGIPLGIGRFVGMCIGMTGWLRGLFSPRRS